MFISKAWTDYVEFKLEGLKSEIGVLSAKIERLGAHHDNIDSRLTRLTETTERTLDKLNALAEHFNLQITYPGGLAKVDEIPVECFPCSKCHKIFPVDMYWSKETSKDRLCDECKDKKSKGGASK